MLLRRRRLSRRVAVLLAAIGALLAAAGICVAVLWVTTPGVGDAPVHVAAILRAHGGQAIGRPLPGRVARATVAVEDKRFYHHGAIDPEALARAAWQ
jgi:hypothetical protein